MKPKFYIPICIKSIVIGLLLVCFLKVPYGYYEFVRINISLAFAALAYTQYKNKHHLSIYACLIVAIIFNPIIPFRFPKTQWEIIDAYTMFSMAIWIFFDIKKFLKLKKNLRIAQQEYFNAVKNK